MRGESVAGDGGMARQRERRRERQHQMSQRGHPGVHTTPRRPASRHEARGYFNPAPEPTTQPGAYGSPFGGGCSAEFPRTSSITRMLSELPMT
jgi:hypothetical protein